MKREPAHLQSEDFSDQDETKVASRARKRVLLVESHPYRKSRTIKL